MGSDRPKTARKVNKLAIITFALAVLMVIVFFAPVLYHGVADIKVGEAFLLNDCFMAMIPLGLVGLVSGIMAIVQINKNHTRGLWLSIFGIIINTVGAVYMFLVVRLLIILSRSF
jgi:hypothetical protein